MIWKRLAKNSRLLDVVREKLSGFPFIGFQSRTYGSSDKIWAGSGIALHCPTRQTPAVPPNSPRWLQRQNLTSASQFIENRRFFGVSSTGTEAGVGEQNVSEDYKSADHEENVEGTTVVKIHPELDSTFDEAWYIKYNEVKQYIKKHGRLPSRADDPVLAAWIYTQRYEYKKWLRKKPSSMTPLRIEALEALPGWEWDPLGARWEAKYQELKEYVEKHGGLPSTGDPNLGEWIRTQRKEYWKCVAGKPSSMTEKRIEALEALPGWEWKVDVAARYDAEWNAKRKELEEWIAENGMLPKTTHPTWGRWIRWQRHQYKKGELSSERIAAVESIPQWKWEGR